MILFLFRYCLMHFICILVLLDVASAADLLIYNGPIYTVDEKQPRVEAVAIREGKIVFAGSLAEASDEVDVQSGKLDLNGKTLIPGLIESHAHLMGLGYAKLNLDLRYIKNYDEMIQKVADAVSEAEPGEWILGRGWHQSKWDEQPAPMVLGYQVHQALSTVSPENPVWLAHASGHAGFANARAMTIAGVDADTHFAEDGEVIKDDDGQPTGILTENAQSLITRHIPENSLTRQTRALSLAIDESLRHGITSFQDAGSGAKEIELYRAFLRQGKLDINLWVMLQGRDNALLQNWYAKGPLIDPDGRLTVRAIKLYADGALGSRGAWLLEEYSDRPGHFGNAVMSMKDIGQVATESLMHGFQLCTHAIGDRANHEVLNQYQQAFDSIAGSVTDHRFRIEHAQHISPDDIHRFQELGVIASMQGIHMSSDRPWAIDRLGRERILSGAYVWQKLIQSGAMLINGTDAPVEPIDPMASFYALVTRKTLDGTPDGGYEADQRLSRQQALTTLTLNAAYGAFEEDIKGSIQPGKRGDFTVLSQDIMQVPEEQILNTVVEYTIVGGDVKYQRQ